MIARLFLGIGLAALVSSVASGEASLGNGPDGAVFTVAGDAPKMPNGTVLHVTLTLPGNFDPPNQISFFQVRVRGERYSARKTWAKQMLAPLVYAVRVDLLMSEQPPALRRQLMKGLGYRFDDRKLLSVEEVVVGTEKERETFKRSALEGLQTFLARVRGLRAAISEAATANSAKDPAWVGVERDLLGRLRACQRDLRAHVGLYLAWRDRDVIQGLQSGLNDVSRALRAHSRGKAGVTRDLIRLAHRLELVQGDLKGRLDKKTPQINATPPKTPHKKPEREE